MIKNVIFDIGKVLVSFEWQKYLHDIGIEGEAYRQIAEHIFEDAWIRMDKEACDEAETRRRAVEAVPDYPREANMVYDHLYDISSPFDYAYDWLQSVKDRGYKIYLLSNFGKFPFEVLSPKYTFLELADGRVISYELEEVKPDRAIYDFLLQKYHLNPAQCVFIDDRRENVAAAQELGMTGIVFTGYEQASRQLDRIL